MAVSLLRGTAIVWRWVSNSVSASNQLKRVWFLSSQSGRSMKIPAILEAFKALFPGEEISGFFRAHFSTLTIQFVSTILIYLLIKYRFKEVNPKHLKLKKSTVERLIKEYEPAPLAEPVADEELPGDHPVYHDFASYDIFNLAGRFKDEIKTTIKAYGIGTCGPRGFYGTMDIHIQLENRLCTIFKKESAIYYSNHFTCLESIVACFCRNMNTVYFPKFANKAMLCGLYHSRATSIVYENLQDLRAKLSKDTPNKYVIVERFGKNTGEIADMDEVIGLRKEFGFRLILDESFSIPFLYQAPESAFYDEVDVVVGSLCYGYPISGGFACGSCDVVNYQRLSAQSYVFSASMPAFLVKAALCCLDTKLSYEGVQEKIVYAFGCIRNIVSSRRSPILLVGCKAPRKLQRYLCRQGYPVGVNGNYLRICLNENTDEKNITKIGKLIDKHEGYDGITGK